MNKTTCDTANKNCVCEDGSLPVKGKIVNILDMGIYFL